MKIKVEQKHIDEGEKGNCNRCAVALALAEQTHKHVIVEDGSNLTIGAEEMMSSNAAFMDCFIIKFDKGERVEPFEFELLPRICDYEDPEFFYDE